MNKPKGAIDFQTFIVRSLRCALAQLASLLAKRRFAKNGAGSDPIGIPITEIMIFPIEKKQSCIRNFIPSLSNDLVKTK